MPANPAVGSDRRSCALERVDLLDLRDRPLAALSGGQRKRAFARALLNASVLLLDEPFNGVDVRTEKLMAELFLQLRNQGCSILISTHDLSHVRDFCDLVVLINKTVLAYGETSEVFTLRTCRWPLVVCRLICCVAIRVIGWSVVFAQASVDASASSDLLGQCW